MMRIIRDDHARHPMMTEKPAAPPRHGKGPTGTEAGRMPPVGARPSPTLTREPGERLSWMSSGLPWFLVSQDGVEDGEELAGDGDEGDHLGLAGGAEAIAEGLEDGVCDGWRRGLRGTGRSARSCGRRRSCSCPSTGRTGGGWGEGPRGGGAFFFWGGAG